MRPSSNGALDHRDIREIQRMVDKQARKGWLVEHSTWSNVKGKIAGWKSGLNEILQVFNVC